MSLWCVAWVGTERATGLTHSKSEMIGVALKVVGVEELDLLQGSSCTKQSDGGSLVRLTVPSRPALGWAGLGSPVGKASRQVARCDLTGSVVNLPNWLI